MQVAAGGLDMAMAQQPADGVQVHPGFQQVRREAVPQRVGAADLADSGIAPRGLVVALHARGAQRLLGMSIEEQPPRRLLVTMEPSAVLAQQHQQGRAQQGVAVGTALACDHAHAHAVARAVDVGHAQVAAFGQAQPAGIQRLQQHAVHGALAVGKKLRHLLASQQFGPLLRRVRHRGQQALARLGLAQHMGEQETAGCGHMVDGRKRQLALLDEVDHVDLNLVRRQFGRAALEEPRHPAK